jgi:hypothetical protein
MTTPEFVLECDAVRVANMATRARRAERLSLVERDRGKEYADRLRARAIVLWKELQNAKSDQVDA